MTEIKDISPNGYSVISTFSGGGGSSTGYRLAGYRVLWANEFVVEAQRTYQANYPETILDTRDIRTIKGTEILRAIGMRSGELDIFDGSPPCASFSTAGKREEAWGKVKPYSDTKQRVDDLFWEYARLVSEIQPKVFIAENVSGLVKGVSKGYFKEILTTLRACGYRVQAKLLDAQWLGVPQARQRIVFIGVRNDLGLSPSFPKPLPYRYSVREVLPHVLDQGDNGGFGKGSMREAIVPDGTIGASPQTGNGTYSPAVIRALATHKGERSLDEPSPTVLTHGRRATTSELSLVVEPETSFEGCAIASEWEKTALGASNERYYMLKRAPLESVSQTISAIGGNKGTASVTHPTERRKFSIAELKRICSFPDDYILTGTYAQQWERCGRAVPPLMMAAIAKTIQTETLDRL